MAREAASPTKGIPIAERATDVELLDVVFILMDRGVTDLSELAKYGVTEGVLRLPDASWAQLLGLRHGYPGRQLIFPHQQNLRSEPHSVAES
jgi:hypothetical protein